MKLKIFWFFLCILTLGLTLSPVCFAQAGSYSSNTIEIRPTSYCGRSYSDSRESLTSNHFGTMLAYGLESTPDTNGQIPTYRSFGALNLSFDYSALLLPHPAADDHETVVLGDNLGASVRKGSLTVYKSVGNAPYERVSTTTNVFESHPFGVEEFYIASTNELRQGLRLKVILAYRLANQRYTQIYEFAVAPLSFEVLLRDLTTDDTTAFLSDGSTTTTGFEILSMGLNSVYVTNDGIAWDRACNGDSFTDPGKYVLRAIATDGTEKRTTIYVLPSASEALEGYFGSPSKIFISEESRIFMPSGTPTYLNYAKLPFRDPTLSALPFISGKLTNLDNGSEIIINSAETIKDYFIRESGRWKLELITGSGNGSFYTFEAEFAITEDVERSVNKYMMDRHISEGCDLRSFHFTKVPYQADGVIAKSVSDGRVYEVKFNVSLGEQLPNGIYTITEYTSKGTYTYDIVLGEKNAKEAFDGSIDDNNSDASSTEATEAIDGSVSSDSEENGGSSTGAFWAIGIVAVIVIAFFYFFALSNIRNK